MVKVYFKYRKNKPIIQSIKRYNICLKFYSLYNLIQQYPESTFIIKTKIGYKTHIDCLKLRCGGILVLKIN
jgi:ribosomal protein S8